MNQLGPHSPAVTTAPCHGVDAGSTPAEGVCFTCKHCGKSGYSRYSGKEFCNKKCNSAWRLPQQRITKVCTRCSGSWRGSKKRKPKVVLCRSCGMLDRYVTDDPSWKAGGVNWGLGRYGRDKDGLSWRVQQRGALNRDSRTCQVCGKSEKRNPDVHHRVPYRVSFSHALNNLICLCKSCHRKEDAAAALAFIGVVPNFTARVTKPSPFKKCGACGNKTRNDELCRICTSREAIKKIKSLLGEGFSRVEISRKLNMKRTHVYNYVPVGVPGPYAHLLC